MKWRLQYNLASKGRTIPQMSAAVGQTIGGALATATHGASKYGSILLRRFVGPDRDALMSMTYRCDSLFISLSLDGTTDFNTTFREMSRKLIPFKARIESLYPGFKAYVDSRRSYDPQGKFLGLNSPFQ